MERQLFTSVKKLRPNQYVFFRSHASLGLYALFHFMFRFVRHFMDKESDMGFNYHDYFHRNDEANHKWWNMYFLPLMFLPHFLLQISGFFFLIPTLRHPDGNRIWPQYRAEALVFFSRCIALLSLAWYNKIQKIFQFNEKSTFQKPIKTFPFIHITFPIVVITMITADIVAKYYSNKGGGSRTIRDLKAPGPILYLMSAAQFHATLHSLMTNDRMSVQIAALAVVQLSAFGMTLRRKGIISQSFGVFLYGCILGIGMIVIWNELRMQRIVFISITLGNLAALARFEFRCNKYLLWTFMSFLLYALSNSDKTYDFVMISNENRIEIFDWKLFGMISSSLWLLVSAQKHKTMKKHL